VTLSMSLYVSMSVSLSLSVSVSLSVSMSVSVCVTLSRSLSVSMSVSVSLYVSMSVSVCTGVNPFAQTQAVSAPVSNPFLPAGQVYIGPGTGFTQPVQPVPGLSQPASSGHFAMPTPGGQVNMVNGGGVWPAWTPQQAPVPAAAGAAGANPFIVSLHMHCCSSVRQCIVFKLAVLVHRALHGRDGPNVRL